MQTSIVSREPFACGCTRRCAKPHGTGLGALLSFYLNWNYVDMAARLILDKLRQEEGSDIENSHLLEAHFREDESAGSDLGIRFEYATSPPWSSHCPALNVLCPPQMRHDLQDRQCSCSCFERRGGGGAARDSQAE